LAIYKQPKRRKKKKREAVRSSQRRVEIDEEGKREGEGG